MERSSAAPPYLLDQEVLGDGGARVVINTFSSANSVRVNWIAMLPRETRWPSASRLRSPQGNISLIDCGTPLRGLDPSRELTTRERPGHRVISPGVQGSDSAVDPFTLVDQHDDRRVDPGGAHPLTQADCVTAVDGAEHDCGVSVAPGAAKHLLLAVNELDLEAPALEALDERLAAACVLDL